MSAEALGSYMAGVAVSGVLWAIFQNNAGGAWDNAKKSFEAGVEINGEMTYKGSDAHKAAVTGDTVGDPFKDTSGPSMNILIKLTCLVGLVIAPILGGHSLHDTPNNEVIVADEKRETKEVMVTVDMNSDTTDLSVIKVVAVSGNDTVTNKEITIEGETPNIDSIINEAKSSALDSL